MLEVKVVMRTMAPESVYARADSMRIRLNFDHCILPVRMVDPEFAEK